MKAIVVRIPGAEIRDAVSFHAVMARALGLPAFYGANFDALVDCLHSVDAAADGMVDPAIRPGELMLLQINDAELFKRRCPREHGEGDLPEFRYADQAAKGAHSIWKLYYNGSVGGQAIMGIPAVRRLKDARGEAVRVWPFETGFKALTDADLDGVEVVIAEVYPSLLKPTPAPGEVKDLAQVRSLAEHFAKLDEAGKLGASFDAPKGLSEDALAAAATEEGWILGA